MKKLITTLLVLSSLLGIAQTWQAVSILLVSPAKKEIFNNKKLL